MDLKNAKERLIDKKEELKMAQNKQQQYSNSMNEKLQSFASEFV